MTNFTKQKRGNVFDVNTEKWVSIMSFLHDGIIQISKIRLMMRRLLLKNQMKMCLKKWGISHIVVIKKNL